MWLVTVSRPTRSASASVAWLSLMMVISVSRSLHRRLQARVERVEHTGGDAALIGAHRHALIEPELALPHLLQHGRHDRDLDHAEGLVLGVGVDRDLLAGAEMLHVDGHAAVDAIADAAQARLQRVGCRRGRGQALGRRRRAALRCCAMAASTSVACWRAAGQSPRSAASVMPGSVIAA